MSKVIEGLLYSETHEWVKVEDDIAIVGVSDYAQSSLGSVVYVEGFLDSQVSQGEECGAIESVKAASDIIAPVSGTVIEVNNDVVNNPELVNEDPYENWILKIKIDDESELESLLDSKQYEEICK